MDLEQHLKRQMAFSIATYGPGARREGLCDHLTKEITNEILPPEVIHAEAAKEFIDIIILGLDGAWRALLAAGIHWDDIPQEIPAMIEGKHSINEQRTWPDWRTADPTKAIEHDRSGDE